MTTLDDAAERTIEEIANGLSIHSFADAARQAWLEATEAAAKKCEALRVYEGKLRVDSFNCRNDACDDCAAAIRGKG